MLVEKTRNSFTGGVWAPSMYGRTDLDAYPKSVRELENFIVHPHGGISNRGGTVFVGEVKDSSAYTRLIPFQFSVVQSYVLEFGNNYMRVFRDQGRVVDTTKAINGVTAAVPTQITAIANGYTNGDWVVISDTGVEAVDGKTLIVKNVTTNTFEVTDIEGNDIDSTGSTPYVSGGDSNKVVELAHTYTTEELPLLKINQSADVLFVTHPNHPPREISRLSHTQWTIADIAFVADIEAPTGVLCTGSGTAYKVTAVDEDGQESLPSALEVGAPANAITWNAVTGASYYNVYKELNESGSYFWIGQAADLTFTEPSVGINPDENKAPPGSRDPFDSADNYPGCSAFYEQRLVYGRTNNKPQTLFGSGVGSFSNMNVSSPLRDDDAYTFTINARQVNDIKAMVALNHLLIFTSGSEWKMEAGGSSDAVTPSSVNMQLQSQWGSSDIQPVVIGNDILIVENSQEVVRSLAYSFEAGAFVGSDKSILAKHLFENSKIRNWCYQQHPESIVWVVLEDGSLLSLTYQLEHKVFAWATHTTEGTFDDVASIVAGGGNSELWTIAKREINGVEKRFIEVGKDRLKDNDIKNAYFVDSGLSYDNPIAITDIARLNPAEVTAPNHGLTAGDKIDIEGIVGTTELNGNRYTVGTVNTPDEFELVDVNGALLTEYKSGGVLRKAITTLSGLDHLEGKPVAVLADGNVVPNITVVNGGIQIPHLASRVHVGLGYESKVLTLDFDLPTQNSDTIQGRIRDIKYVTLRLKDSRSIFAGPSEGITDEVPFRTEEELGQPITLFSGDKEVNIESGETNESRVFMSVSDPVPLTILEVIAGIEYGEY